MLHFIVNPRAKNIEKLRKELEARLQEEGVSYEFYTGTDREDARAHVREITAAGEQTVVAVGGDGTVNDVLGAIAEPENVKFGVIPAGTGNDFAAAAHIPEGLAALELILHGEPKQTDFIACEGGLRSMNIAGLGIDVDILQRCNAMKHGGAKSKYFRSLLASLRKYKGQEIEVTLNGETHTMSALIAAVCNGTMLGGGIPICPAAMIDDGKLDLVLIRQPKRWKIPYYLIQLMRGKALGLPVVRHILCERVRIVQKEGAVVQLDGELFPSQVLDARIERGKLKMYRG